MKISELNSDQRGHLVGLLDHRTACGLLTACSIANGELFAEKTLQEVFEWAGKTPRSAKNHARKVEAFVLTAEMKRERTLRNDPIYQAMCVHRIAAKNLQILLESEYPDMKNLLGSC